MRRGSELHEKELQDYCTALMLKGYRVILLRAVSPDAIAIKDDEVCAVEVLGSYSSHSRGYYHGWTVKNKEEQYSMFDRLLIREFRYPSRRFPHEETTQYVY